jgi:alpha-1,3-rhamnosyl/mannosyltransferase
MRIALDTTFAGINPTGVGVYSRQLLAALRRLAAQGADDPFKTQNSKLKIQGFGPSAHPTPHRWRDLALENPLATQGWLPLRLLGWRPDIVHSTAFVGPLWGPGRLVVTFHDTIYHRYPADYDPLWLRVIRTLAPRTLRRARAVLCDSAATRADVLATYRVDPRKLHVVYLGLDPAFHAPISTEQVAAVRARHGLAGRYVLHAGALVRRKNLPLLVRAFSRYAQAHGDGETVLALTGRVAPGMPGGAEIAQAIAASPVRGRIRLLGQVARADLPALVAGAAALAYPTLYEGAGLPPLEAMAVGTPVLASTTPAVAELAGPAALLADPHDEAAWAAGLARLLHDPGLRAHLQAAGHAHAAPFTWDRCAAETGAVYRRVLAKKEQNK